MLTGALGTSGLVAAIRNRRSIDSLAISGKSKTQGNGLGAYHRPSPALVIENGMEIKSVDTLGNFLTVKGGAYGGGDVPYMRFKGNGISFSDAGNGSHIAFANQNADYGNMYFGYNSAIGASVIAGFTYRGWCFLGPTVPVYIGSTSVVGASGVSLYAPANYILEQRFGINAQTFRVYSTYTSATSYETLNLKGKAAANFEIGPENGSAGGTLRGLTIGGYALGSATIKGWLQFRPNATTAALEAFYLGPIADSTTVGGNARGTYSLDLQRTRNNANQVASGDYALLLGGYNNRVANGYNYGTIINGSSNQVTGASAFIGSGHLCTASGVGSTIINGNTNTASAENSFIGGGYNNTASAHQATIVGGQHNTASGSFAFIGCGDTNTASASYSHVAGGQQAVANRYGMAANAAGQFAAAGDAQSARFVLRRKTTDATATTLMLDGATTRLTITSGKIMFADILISGIRSDGLARACYKRKVAIVNVAGVTSLVAAAEAIGTDIEDNVLTDVVITADNTNDALDISVTGIAAETWRWVAVVSGLEIAYGT